MQDQPGLESDPSYSEAAEQSQPAAAETNVIVLVHGIRDFGLWESTIRDTLEKEGFKVEPTNYGRLNLIEFLLPMWFFRRRAIEEVKKQIEIVVMNNSGKPISIIAHSFGTFVIAHLMKDAFALRFRRVVFCGSVVPYGFGFEQFQDRYSAPILNEVGTRDVWPAVAESVTTGYGSAGTYGFLRPLVRDRWHNGAGHGYFLDPAFCRKFWVPFLRNGEIVPASEKPERPRAWLQLLSIFKVKYIVAVLLSIAVAFALATFVHRNFPHRQTRHQVPYESWLRADSKGVLVARAFAIQGSLARVASTSTMGESNRQLAAIQNGVLTKHFLPLYVCAFGRAEDCPPWSAWSSATADYSKALFDFAKAFLLEEDARRLVNLAKDSNSDLIRLLDVLVELGESASGADPTGTLSRDAVAFEVKMWLATPAIDERPTPERVTEAQVAALKAISESAGADQQRSLAAINELRKAGLKPLASANLLYELGSQLSYICDQITQDRSARNACKMALPVPR